MQHWDDELASTEAAALRIEGIELDAERRFDGVFLAAEQAGSTEAVTRTPEFQAWMAARAATDAAWGRWAQVMHTRLDAQEQNASR